MICDKMRYLEYVPSRLDWNFSCINCSKNGKNKQKCVNGTQPQPYKIEYCKNNKQNLSSHLEFIVSENSQFVACNCKE